MTDPAGSVVDGDRHWLGDARSDGLSGAVVDGERQREVLRRRIAFAVVGLSSSADDWTAMVWSSDGAAGFEVAANDVRRLVQAVEGAGVGALAMCGAALVLFSEVSVVAEPADEKREDTRSVALDAATMASILWGRRR